MRTFFLIGGIGSGKSSTLDAFSDLGAYTVDLDKIGHDILHSPKIIHSISQSFGREVLNDDGQIDRARLAKKAFADKDATAKLNLITHPAIMSEALRRVQLAQRQSCPCAIVEFSAYRGPEATWKAANEHADKFPSTLALVRQIQGVIAVVAPEDMRIARACAKGFQREDVLNRIAQQPTDDQRRAWADYVIVNDGSLSKLTSQVHNVFQQIMSAQD